MHRKRETQNHKGRTETSSQGLAWKCPPTKCSPIGMRSRRLRDGLFRPELGTLKGCPSAPAPSPTVQAPSLAGHGQTALGPRPIPRLSRPCVPTQLAQLVQLGSRVARLSVLPVYGPIRYRTPPALCPEDLSIWRNGSSVLASPAWLPHGCLAPILRPLGCAGRLDADVQTVPSMALGLDLLACGLCCSHVVAVCYLETFRCLTD